MTPEIWHARLDLLREIRAAKIAHEGAIKLRRIQFDQETREHRDRLAQLEAQEATIMAGIKEHAIANYQRSGQKTFAGVQVRATKKLNIVDIDAAINLLDGQQFDNKPCVIKKLDERIALKWAEAMNAVGAPVAGLEIVVEYSVAVLLESEAQDG
jgi:hypothetical protein